MQQVFRPLGATFARKFLEARFVTHGVSLILSDISLQTLLPIFSCLIDIASHINGSAMTGRHFAVSSNNWTFFGLMLPTVPFVEW